eukprot:CAMPEP_0173152980 /NCGR_PEP_ID=MMETSP1105-20130129/12576_1 /TAXON_ID=2985 /ORGANISM="Ochromonas sp., Strain BG-1" /LENGTH=286 /DNA_ID=CAMNT_0014068805 /DNA_START=111 /DNA_END=967 /DNA_ORIENTATION=+
MGPNELKVSDQFTLRVYAPANVEELEQFVVHHSICPVVHEIQILWHNSQLNSPPVESFPYTTAHSKVSFHYFHDSSHISQQYFQTDNIKTKAVMYMDADVFVSCDDLNFAYSVWRSSDETAVGFFPRSIKKVKTSGDATRFEFESVYNVALKNEYHLLLSSAILLKKDYIENLAKSESAASLLKSNPECASIIISSFLSSVKPHLFPLWVEASELKINRAIELMTFPTMSKESQRNFSSSIGRSIPLTVKPLPRLTTEDYSRCINLAAKEMKINGFRKSFLKSTNA